MSKLQGKGNSFPPLQKRIILHLAENGPQTINETNKGISGDYKSSHIAFQTLKKKGLIKEVTSKPYRGREYPQLWLTDRGIFLALCQGARPQTILRRTLEIYPEDKGLQFVIEAVPILGKNAFDVLYLAASTNGQIEQTDVDSILAAQMQKKLSPEVIKQFIAVLKKYPAQHKRTVDSIEQARKNLSEVSDML
ncbi:MAG: hypothetical protein ABSF24_10780 [Candidatus Bathyarchaeia archaeon]|jgi:hypothetical protein